jgi:hypothetical protein
MRKIQVVIFTNIFVTKAGAAFLQTIFNDFDGNCI